MSNKYISEQSNQFKNKIIIVTGSTQGSGAETAKLLANRGARGITICGRNNEKGNKVKSEIESMGTECLYVQADLEKLEDCKKIVSETDKKAIESSAANLRNSLKGTDVEEIKKKTQDLVQASMKLGEAIYKSQQSAKPEDAPKDAKKEDTKDDNVVDADFEEVKDENKEKSA